MIPELIQAIINNDLPNLRIILQQDPNLVNEKYNEEYPLFYAVQRKHTEIALELLDKAPILI
jgi:hypothetical protein